MSVIVKLTGVAVGTVVERNVSDALEETID